MIDRYTKAVLTIIAVCLAIIAFKGSSFTREAQAQMAPMTGQVHVVVDHVAPYAFQYTVVPVRVSQ